MSEWIVLFSIIYDWRKGLSKEKKVSYSLAYQLMILADIWVFLNLFLALLISIPSINLFTHGTHITVAHSMGTTIGINTFILLSSLTYILEFENPFTQLAQNRIKVGIRIFNGFFLAFWIIMLIMGAKKGYWTFFSQNISFAEFQNSLHWIYIMFTMFGIGLLVGLYIIVFELLNNIRGIINKKA